MSKTGNSDSFMLMRTTPYWNSQNLWETKTKIAKLREILKRTNAIESCTKEKSNTKWRFYNQTNLIIFAALLRERPIGLQGFGSTWTSFEKAYSQLPYLRTEHQKNHTKTIFASSEHLLSTCMEMIDLKKTHGNFSVSFSLTVQA